MPKFEKWNYVHTDELAEIKPGIVVRERRFLEMITEHFTPYYQPLVPWVNRLRMVVFPMDKPWENKYRELCFQTKAVLEKAPEVLTEW